MIRKIIIDKPQQQKKNIVKPLNKEPVDCINMLFLNQNYEGSDIVEREIKKKISGYRAQDVKKKRCITREHALLQVFRQYFFDKII